MAICVRLYHREHLRGADPFADDAGVMAQRTPIDLGPAAEGLAHFFFGVVICGSRRYIGSSGGRTNARFGSRASSAKIRADGCRTVTPSNCGKASMAKIGIRDLSASRAARSSASL